jgi:hypothetical protein
MSRRPPRNALQAEKEESKYFGSCSEAGHHSRRRDQAFEATSRGTSLRDLQLAWEVVEQSSIPCWVMGVRQTILALKSPPVLGLGSCEERKTAEG